MHASEWDPMGGNFYKDFYKETSYKLCQYDREVRYKACGTKKDHSAHYFILSDGLVRVKLI